MLQITPQHKLMIAVKAVDFRRGIDGLIAISRSELNSNPFNGCLFAFRNKRNTSIKLLIFDGNGFWLAQKRFSVGKLRWWPQNEEQAKALRSVELLIILQQGQPQQVNIPDAWRKLPEVVDE
jgi:transposase